MHVMNTTGDRRYLPAVADWVDDNETVEVDDEVGVSLVEQGWKPVDASRAELAAVAVELGIEVRKSWSAKRIETEIGNARAAQAEAVAAALPDPGPPAPDPDPTTEADPADHQED